jgi:chromosomal replication initiator protein
MDLPLNENYTFDTFVAKGNNPALNLAKKIVTEPCGMYNPVIFCGETGTGKTHLLQAIGNELKNKLAVIYTTVENFSSEFIEAIQTGKVKRFEKKILNAGILLVDGIQYLQGRQDTTKEFCYIFYRLHNKNIQMTFTCDRSISKLTQISDRMIAGFDAGLTIEMPVYGFENKINAI